MDARYGSLRAEKNLFGSGRFVLGVDGKKSDVRQKHGRMLKQDKQVIIDQITKKYLNFFIPEEGDARSMALAFYEYLKKSKLEDILLALSLDGENKNVGADYGFLRQVG